MQEYSSNLTGTTGQLYGNKYTWPFLDGWKQQLDTPGAIANGLRAGIVRAASLV